MKKSLMKKVLFLALVALFLSSCYCDKITVGKVSLEEPLVHVASRHNAHFFMGAVVSHEKAKASLPDVDNYVIAVKRTFGDLLVSGLTLGIYQPTTTKYYIPKANPQVVVIKKKFGSKAYKGYINEK